MKPRIILLNGPAGSGKDSIGKEILNQGLTYSKIRKFAEPLKRAVSAFFNLTPAEYDFYFETYEGKNTRSYRFFGLTPREWLIKFSEDYAKVNGGKDVFGVLLADEIEKDFKEGYETIIVTDSGFQDEALALLRKFDGKADVLIVRLHRNGYTFAGDSRGYITFKDFVVFNPMELDIDNDSMLSDAVYKIESYYDENKPEEGTKE